MKILKANEAKGIFRFFAGKIGSVGECDHLHFHTCSCLVEDTPKAGGRTCYYSMYAVELNKKVVKI